MFHISSAAPHSHPMALHPVVICPELIHSSYITDRSKLYSVLSVSLQTPCVQLRNNSVTADCRVHYNLKCHFAKQRLNIRCHFKVNMTKYILLTLSTLPTKEEKRVHLFFKANYRISSLLSV